MAEKGKGILEVLKETLIAVGVNVAFKEFTEKAGKQAGEHVGEALKKIATDKRAELLEALRLMPKEDTANLIARHKKAIQENRENRFVSLLCKIPRDKTEGRRATLKYLNDLEDEQFWQMLTLLEHDVVPQAFARLLKSTDERLGQASRAAIPYVKNLKGWLAKKGVR